jgi:hypothetical protein
LETGQLKVEKWTPLKKAKLGIKVENRTVCDRVSAKKEESSWNNFIGG